MSQQGSLLGASEKPCSGAMAFGLSCVGGLWSVLSAVSAVLCCVGFYMPYWLSGVVLDAAGAAHDTHLGLFRRCRFRAIVDDRVDVVLACGRYSTFDGIPSGWWKVSTVMVGAGAALALLVTAVALAACCLRHIVTPTSARVAGLLQFLAGSLLGAGCLLYPLGWDTADVTEACGPTAHIYQPGSCSLSWAYFVTIAGTGLTLTCALLSCHAARTAPAHPQPRL